MKYNKINFTDEQKSVSIAHKLAVLIFFLNIIVIQKYINMNYI